MAARDAVSDLIRGNIDAIILCSLSHCDSYGYEILKGDVYKRQVMGHGVTRISARMLVEEIEDMNRDFERAREENVDIKLTLGSRLSPESLAKLKSLRGR